MDKHQKIIIKREDLYERIWQIPARQLAKEYQLSDTRLFAICQILKVPKPAPGYWAKVKYGKNPRRPPLPSRGPGERTEFEHIVEEGHKRPVMNDPDIQGLLEKVPTIRVPERLNDPDPLIRNAKTWIGRKPYGYSAPHTPTHIGLNVHPTTVARALRLMDALIKGLNKLGYKVRGEDNSNRDQYFEILGQRIRFKLREHAKQIDHVLTKKEMADKKAGGYFYAPKYDYLPTGLLELDLDPVIWGGRGYKKKWSDSAKKPLESQLQDIVRGSISLAGELRKEAERHKEAEQVAADQRKKRLEEEMRLAEEEARKRELDIHVQNWAKSKQLRSFIQEFEERLMGGPYTEQAKQDWRSWITWANEYANQLDPIAATLARLANKVQEDS